MKAHLVATFLLAAMWANHTRAELDCEQHKEATACLDQIGGIHDGMAICGWCNSNNKCVRVAYTEEEYDATLHSDKYPDGKEYKSTYAVYPFEIKDKDDAKACTLPHLSILFKKNPNHADPKKKDEQEIAIKSTWPEKAEELAGLIKCQLRGPTNLEPKAWTKYKVEDEAESKASSSADEVKSESSGQKISYTKDEQGNCSTCALYPECSFYDEGITREVSTKKHTYQERKSGSKTKKYTTDIQSTSITTLKNTCVRNGGIFDARLNPQFADLTWSFVLTKPEDDSYKHEASEEYKWSTEKKSATCTWWDVAGYWYLFAALLVTFVLLAVVVGAGVAYYMLVVKKGAPVKAASFKGEVDLEKAEADASVKRAKSAKAQGGFCAHPCMARDDATAPLTPKAQTPKAV